MRKAVFLDRDGTINKLVYDVDHGLVDSPATKEVFTLLEGAGEAIRRLNDLRLLSIVVSNQPGIAKGRFTERHLEEVTAHMTNELEAHSARLDAVYYCLHHPEAVKTDLRMTCDCRKPRPGLLQRSCQEFDIDPSRSYMIGDGVVDVLAGRALGCMTFWIGRPGSDTYKALKESGAAPDFVVDSLLDAVNIIAVRECA